MQAVELTSFYKLDSTKYTEEETIVSKSLHGYMHLKVTFTSMEKAKNLIDSFGNCRGKYYAS